MKKFCIFLLLGLIAAACALAPASTPTQAPQPTDAAPVVIRISYPTSPGIGDVPLLMALDALKAQGYDVQTTQLAKFDLNIAALANGELDIASGGNQTAWAAIAEGATMRTIVGRLSNPDAIVAKADITTCAELAGKSVALSGTTTVGAALLTQYIKRNCEGTTPEILVIASSSNRMPALLSGEIDAAQLQLDDLLEITQESPDGFHALVSFASEFPEVQVLSFHAATGFAEQHPQAIKDFIRALLEAERSIQDQKQLVAAAIQYGLLDEAQAEVQAAAYLEHMMWHVNGGLTQDNVQYTLDFLVEAGVLDSGLTAPDVADLSYLNAVLDEVGRK